MATRSTPWLSNTHRLKSTLGFVFALAFVSALVACGGSGGGGNSSSSGSNDPAPTPTLSLLAGNVGGSGYVDGTGSEARFLQPTGVAVDGSGNIYVADTGNHTIRKITAAGVVTTLAGAAGTSGSADGTGSAARFYSPNRVAVDHSGNLYVTDKGNHTVRKITPTGDVTTLAGTAGTPGSADGTGSAASFNSPSGVAVDGSGNIYVADRGNHTIRKIAPAGDVTTLAGTAGTRGSADGNGSAASFGDPSGVAVDSKGNIYVANLGNATIRKITPAGDVTTLTGTAGACGKEGSAARLCNPTGIAVDHSGNIYVVEQVLRIIRKITPAGDLTTLAGKASNGYHADGTGSAARFTLPIDVAVDDSGDIYVTDPSDSTIRKITPAGVVTTLAGASPNLAGSADGTGSAARFSYPIGIAADRAGSIYVGDRGNSAIRKITPAGDVTTLAGTAGTSGSADGTGTSASFIGPSGVAVDGSGNVYVADSDTIRKITPAGDVTTLAGTAGTSGSADGTGAAARFDSPTGIAVDSTGNAYVADVYNHTIRKITPAGDVSTLAGSPGNPGSADGIGAAARFNSPVGIVVDKAGNIYVGDSDNHTIRKITPTGMVTTLAGSPGNPGSADGIGADARFNAPNGVAVDGTGNVYVADRGNHTIRKITPAGAVTTVVGQAGIASFVPGALPGLLTAPIGVAIGGGSLYITTNNAVVKVSNVP